ADPALPLALGGAGLTLREMTGLYAGLAASGSGPLTLVPSVVRPPAAQTEASRMVAEILTQNLPGGAAGIAWKTGTSWGGRDAWAFGFDLRHVVGVWIGRPDGTPLPGATGRSLAVPVLAQVFDMLPAAPRPAPRPIAMAPPPEPQSGLRLLFPPPDAVLAGDGPVTLRAMGGRRPLTFMVDGAPLPIQPAQRQAGWLPPGPGFYSVTVLDADGLVARAPVRVQ
ncbi:MAG TPA: penicillin-binding protein 1C, partial [Acetobacteraceae bacterium]|nr:penicillin-binding protein 1C [Acetobacteraceae bacterium]